MRVAFDGRVIADHYPGIGRYAFGLARALAELADVMLIMNPEALNTRFPSEAIAARRIPVPAGPASPAAQWLVPRALARTGADIYHSPYFLMPYGLGHGSRVRRQGSRATRLAYCAIRYARSVARIPANASVPVLVTFYDLTPLLPGSGYGAAARLIVGLAHRLAALSAARIIVLSRWAKEAFAQVLRLQPDRVAVIPPGIDLAFRPRPREEVEAVRARLALPEQYLLSVGAFRPHKNLGRLVQAHGRLPQGVPPLVLAGIGIGSGLKRSAAGRSAGQVRYLGPVAEADLPALYTGATVFVMPSLAEGFGLPVLEAMACGTPVACSTAQGLDEGAGPAARFDALDVENMTDVLAGLLGDDEGQRERREAGLEHAAAFTWERAAAETLRVYEAASTDR